MPKFTRSRFAHSRLSTAAGAAGLLAGPLVGAARRYAQQWKMGPGGFGPRSPTGSSNSPMSTSSGFRTPTRQSNPPAYSFTTPRSRRAHIKTSGPNIYGRNKGGFYKGIVKRKRMKFKKRPIKIGKKNGVVFKTEYGSLEATTMSESIYIGHAAAATRVVDVFYMALIKKLFNAAGINFGSFDDKLGRYANNLWGNVDSLMVVTSFRNSASDASGFAAGKFEYTGTYSDTVGGATALTIKDFCDGYEVQVRNNINPTTEPIEGIVICNIALYATDSLGTNDRTLLANITPEDVTVKFILDSNLVVQNRTNDASGSSNVLSTSNNPVHGKMYSSYKKWLNGFDLTTTSQDIQAGYLPLYSNQDSGIIATNSSVTESVRLQKPPQGWALGAAARPLIINPGNIKRSKIKFKCRMSFNSFFNKLGPYYWAASTAGRARIEFGFAEMFGLECMMYDRTETTQLQIGWELNQTYRCEMSKKQTRVMPIVRVF